MHLSDPSDKIFVAGHRGLVGSAVSKALKRAGFRQLIRIGREALDLRVEADVHAFFKQEKPDFVVLAAAKVGGILANSSWPVDFLVDNLRIQTNVIRCAHESGVKRLLFLGSSCIYPKQAPQPLKEEYLLTGPLESTNEAYAVAKIAGIHTCRSYHRQFGDDFISVMPTNLYGPEDNFDLQTSHVLPALIRKFHEAKVQGKSSITLWGTGTPRREFLHSRDMAVACVHMLQQPSGNIDAVAPDRLFNLGVGEDLTILDLAIKIREVVGVDCSIELDTSKPDGTPRKLMDVTRMTELGWTAGICLDDGIRDVYEWYKSNHETVS